MPHKGASDDGFATAAAMAVSLAVGLGAGAVLIRAAGDLRVARNDFERTKAAYALDAVQTLAAEDLLHKDPEAKLRRVAFDTLTATVRVQEEAEKLKPVAAAALPNNWFASLGVEHPDALKARLQKSAAGRPWTLDAIAGLDIHPLWKACAASAMSASGSSQGLTKDQLDPRRLPRTVRLTAEGDGGWVEDRIVRLSSDPAAPVLVLDRRLYRRRGETEPPCPSIPEPARS